MLSPLKARPYKKALIKRHTEAQSRKKPKKGISKMNKNSLSKAWRQYEAGRKYKHRIGLYETVRENERFYRGDQWKGSGASDLPRPIFNVVRRITDYLISTAAVGEVRITYTDENLPFVESSAEAEAISEGVRALTENAAYRWERDKMQAIVYRLLTDAALSGDGIIYCGWDAFAEGNGIWNGDIFTGTIDNVNVFPANVNDPDIQSQSYIIISGKASLSSIRKEAMENGVSFADAMKIVPDGREDGINSMAGDLAEIECEYEPEDAPVTYLIKFWKENGYVMFEKSVRNCIIRRSATPCKLYPFAKFSWYSSKNCFHGTSAVSGMIANQKYINRAYAMLMKHMTDTAFSKVIYDRTRIPEWTNGVGEAIAAVGGGNIADAVQVVGTGQLEEGYLELIDNAIAVTKELAGATETSLGNIAPTNTSAILALRESSMQALERVRADLNICLEQMANIWADITCGYCPSDRPMRTAKGAEKVRMDVLRNAMLHAKIDVSDSSRFSASGTQSILDSLLFGGHITVCEYLERLPDGLIPDRYSLLEARRRLEDA